jgi:hypothetical protein
VDLLDNSFKRIYLGNDAWASADADCMGLASHPIKALTRLAGYCESMEVASEGLETWMNVFRTLQGLEIWRTHSQWIQRPIPCFGIGLFLCHIHIIKVYLFKLKEIGKRNGTFLVINILRGCSNGYKV